MQIAPDNKLFPVSLLLITGILLLVGEMLGERSLSIVGNYISEFAARRNNSGTLVRASMWSMGLTYLATAAVVLRWNSGATSVKWGCLCLAAAASLLPFVAEYQLWVVPTDSTWGPRWLNWIWHHPPQKPLDAIVREDVHTNTITASVYWIAGGMILIGIGARRSCVKVLPISSLILAIATLLLFKARIYVAAKGLVELLGFGCIGTWLVFVNLFTHNAAFESPPKKH